MKHKPTPGVDEYDSRSITVLEGLSAVRERPGMYIGDKGFFGLHHLIMEVINNCVDEHLAGFCSNIEVVFRKDGYVVVKDDGRGIPIDKHVGFSDKYGKNVSAIELVLGHLHAGGKFEGKAYKVSGGLHGVGISCVNALSTHFIARVLRKGKLYEISFKKGVLYKTLSVIDHDAPAGSGTEIWFMPDDSIFASVNFDLEYLSVKLKEMAVLSKGLKIVVKDFRKDLAVELEYYYPGGISSYIKNIAGTTPLCDPISISGEKEEQSGSSKIFKVDVAFVWVSNDQETVLSYVNNICTPSGGGHVSGFYAAVTRSINNYIKNTGGLKGKNSKLTILGEDVREGLVAMISLYLDAPQFEGQTKQRLGNSDVAAFVQQVVGDKLSVFLEENRSVANRIIDRVAIAAHSREASKRAREMVQRKNALDGARLPGKLVDCIAGAEFSELYIVEGDSAGGSAKMGRIREFQAVLPLRGKIINVEKASLDKVLQNEEIQALVAALGAGIGETWDISKLRYNKIIIMTDADVDGSHIMSLLLTFFHRFMPELITAGNLYVAQPPLYKMMLGKKQIYIHNEIELESKLLDIGIGNVTLHSIEGASCKIAEESSKSIVSVLFEIHMVLQLVEKRGLSIQEFISLYIEKESLPRFIMRINNERHILYDVQEVLQLADEHAIVKNDRFFEFIEGKIERLVSKVFSITVLFAKDGLHPLIRKLKSYDLDLDSFLVSKDPVFSYYIGDGVARDAYSFLDVLDAVKMLARSGMELYRYKGLGEMNDEELGSTTMDPKNRTLLRVICDCNDEVTYIRDLLMGENVAPRKDFITAFALSISNLDI